MAGTAKKPVSGAVALTFAVSATAIGVLPAFLPGALATEIHRDFPFSPTTLGAVVAVFFFTSTLLSAPAGGLVERVGARAGIRLSTSAGAAALLVAALANGPALLFLASVFGGVSNAVGQLAANMLITRRVPLRRHGVALGVKQAAVPTAAALAGLALPVVGLTLGWRWAYAGGACLSLAFSALVSRLRLPQDVAHRLSDRPVLTRQRELVLLAAASGVAVSAANVSPAFLVDSTVRDGLAPEAAGLLLALGSATGAAMRIVAGWYADRGRVHDVTVMVTMLCTGSVGLALLGIGGSAWLLAAGTVLAFGAGWGWNSVLTLAVIRRHPATPAAATGVTQTALYAGGVIGPLGFGAFAGAASYSAAWTFAAAVMITGAVGIALASRALKWTTSG